MTQTTRSIETYTALSMDGFVSGPDGRPSHLSLPTYEPGKTHGFREFQAGCGAVAMGRTTFEPALTNPWWPWPDLRVYVLSEHELPEGTPDEVVRVPGGPRALVDRLRGDDFDGDVHVVGGPTLIRGLWQLRAIDELGFLIVPLLFGQGLALFPLTDAPEQQGLELVEQHAYPDGALAVRYAPAPDLR
jgi:dihydrofolate reductase